LGPGNTFKKKLSGLFKRVKSHDMGDDLLFYSFDILLIIENPQGRLPLPQNLMFTVTVASFRRFPTFELKIYFNSSPENVMGPYSSNVRAASGCMVLIASTRRGYEYF
jgi:hypothetical protein